MISAIDPIGAAGLDFNVTTTSTGVGRASFTQMLADGVERTNDRLLEADRLTQAFALGEDVPVHQVMFAIEQARLSLELMNQVRGRLIEGYQEILRMQV
ncbi:flagellar hook-basal body complex protein FliE [Brevundimonas sp.]|jgi:flagellar hook-basal body complex protein FliE|uniref:flagellar hook-basal body complex protein FliE n=1 Tax=Brevundimonas sp. TaxID=1871086 RepID=UPI002E0FD9CD|nr:flagellar hook-basal body complex protein FliE [Brevundimonas sp.]